MASAPLSADQEAFCKPVYFSASMLSYFVRVIEAMKWAFSFINLNQACVMAGQDAPVSI